MTSAAHLLRPVAACVAGAVFAMLAVVPAAAQTGPASAPKARAAPARTATKPVPVQARVLTPAQLKDCLAQQTRAESDSAEAERERLSIEALKNELRDSGTALDAALAALDRTDPVAVEAHNQKVRERDARIDGYDARVAAYNTRAEGWKATRDAFVKACDTRRYDERDLQDLKKTR